MSYDLRIDNAAAKEIRKLDPKIQARVMKALRALQADPFRPGAKGLTNTENMYRYRVGDYRILYTVDGKRLVVWIVAVRHRSKAYRGMKQ